MVILTHQEESVPWKVIKDSMVPLIKTPKRLPITFPTPPVRRVPPITEDAMASISNPLACSTKPEHVFIQNRRPPSPARNPSST